MSLEKWLIRNKILNHIRSVSNAVKPITIHHNQEDKSLLRCTGTSNLEIPQSALQHPSDSSPVPLKLTQEEPSRGLQLVIQEFILTEVGFPPPMPHSFYDH